MHWLSKCSQAQSPWLCDTACLSPESDKKVCVDITQVWARPIRFTCLIWILEAGSGLRKAHKAHLIWTSLASLACSFMCEIVLYFGAVCYATPTNVKNKLYFMELLICRFALFCFLTQIINTHTHTHVYEIYVLLCSEWSLFELPTQNILPMVERGKWKKY